MSDQPRIHRGHATLLSLVNDSAECTAMVRNGTVHLEGHSQDFLIAWYEDLKRWSLIEAEDLMGRMGKLGERVKITAAGAAALQAQQAS